MISFRSGARLRERRARLDFNSPDEEEKSFDKLYKGARLALLEHWKSKMAFSPYPRAAYDFSASMETLSTLARDARDGNFTLPHGRGRDKKLQNKIERLAHCVQRGRHILEQEKAKPAPARQETPRASRKTRVVMIGGRRIKYALNFNLKNPAPQFVVV